MTTTIIILIASCCVASIVYLIYYYSPKTVILRRFKNLPYSKIGSLQNHKLAKVEGKALHVDQPLIAPLSNRLCVYYKIIIQKKVSTSKNSHWKTVIDEEQFQDFFIEQLGERLLILPNENPKNYYMHIVTDKKGNSGTFKDPTPQFITLLKHYNIEPEGLFGLNKQLRYRESIIEVGERIVVSGIVKWMELENPMSDYNYSRVATLVNKEKVKILITDTPEAIKPRRQY